MSTSGPYISIALAIVLAHLQGCTPSSSCGDTNRCQVFATSVTYSGDLGGLTGADSHCQELAMTAGLTGRFRAWLSTDDESAIDRFRQVSVPYVLTDDAETVVADSFADLTDGSIQNPIIFDEYGDHAGSARPWTGTYSNGQQVPGRNCGGWTTTNSVAAVGDKTATNGAWTYSSNVSQVPCSSTQSLYCFQQ